EQRPVQQGDELRAPTPFTPRVRREMLVTLDEMLGGTASQALLIDARAPERFEGRHEIIDKAAGHIPGASNRCFKENVTGESLMRPADDLRREFVSLVHGTPMQQVVAYCGSGVTACQNLLALEHAGLPGARLYVGSWSEWSSDPLRPIETGEAKRK